MPRNNPNISHYLDHNGRYSPMKSKSREEFLKRQHGVTKYLNFASPIEFYRQKIESERQGITNFVDKILKQW